MGIQFEEARAKVDPAFTKAAGELSDAYYRYWRNGISHPWNGFDLLTKEEFDRIHGALWNEHTLALLGEIEAGNYGYDQEKYDPIDDPETGKRRGELTAERLAEIEQNYGADLEKLRAALPTRR